MGQLKNTYIILGEGLTEFYYFNSLKDVFQGVTISPDSPKKSDLKTLDERIERCIADGYTYIFCVIDMDNKQTEQKTAYQNLRTKYKDNSAVSFFETHRCTELFFLYYFIYTSKNYSNQDSLLKDLCQKCKYEKATNFFLACACKHGGLHNYFTKNGGSLVAAVKNANTSCKERQEIERDYTYSELGRLISRLQRRY